MSFVISALPFMRVNYAAEGGGDITAFATTPSPETLSVMRNHAIVFRPGPAGFSLFYLANPGAPAPPVAAITRRTRFSFHLRLRDLDFFTRFHPDFPAGAPQLLLDNLDAAGAIGSSGPLSAGATVEATDALPVGPNPYPIRVDVVGGLPRRVDALDRYSGATLASTEFDSEASATEIAVTVPRPARADPAVRMLAPAPSTLDRVVYADTPTSDSAAAAVIDLYWDQPQTAVPAPGGAVFDAVFRPRP